MMDLFQILLFIFLQKEYAMKFVIFKKSEMEYHLKEKKLNLYAKQKAFSDLFIFRDEIRMRLSQFGPLEGSIFCDNKQAMIARYALIIYVSLSDAVSRRGGTCASDLAAEHQKLIMLDLCGTGLWIVSR